MAAKPSPITPRISSDCPDNTREVLTYAWNHDLPRLKGLILTKERASARDPHTGETPLHAAIRACGPAAADSSGAAGANNDDVEKAKVLEELFFSGAIWNDFDSENKTPGCVARRLGQMKLYETCVISGLRAELLFAVMDGYIELSSESDADEDTIEDESAAKDSCSMMAAPDASGTGDKVPPQQTSVTPQSSEKAVTNEEYLSSDVTYAADKLLDADSNGVMMAWETDIMQRSVSALVPDSAPGKRILNIGFGMGIIDGMFATLKPSCHHIIEAHPSVLKHARKPDSPFGPQLEDSGPEPGSYKIHAGRWQDVVPKLLKAGEVYDAIFFNTFGEGYQQLRLFFTEYIPGLLHEQGQFGFFNGLGADRRICYDVYTKVVEIHCTDTGLGVEWRESDVDMSGLEVEGEEGWEGVRRRYWTLDRYHLPVCKFLG